MFKLWAREGVLNKTSVSLGAFFFLKEIQKNICFAISPFGKYGKIVRFIYIRAGLCLDQARLYSIYIISNYCIPWFSEPSEFC